MVSSVAVPGTSASKSLAAALQRASRKKHPSHQLGKASWYGRHFHGKKTASGQRYDMFEFTAAHPELPMGSWVRVTNLRNGRWVLVKINDRGPLRKSRIIDLSYGAAKVLDMKRNGVDQVRVDMLDPDELALLKQPDGNTVE